MEKLVVRCMLVVAEYNALWGFAQIPKNLSQGGDGLRSKKMGLN